MKNPASLYITLSPEWRVPLFPAGIEYGWEEDGHEFDGENEIALFHFDGDRVDGVRSHLDTLPYVVSYQILESAPHEDYHVYYCRDCRCNPCQCGPEVIYETPGDNGRGSIKSLYSHPNDWSPFDEQCPR